jgi:hypothetical protein
MNADRNMHGTASPASVVPTGAADRGALHHRSESPFEITRRHHRLASTGGLAGPTHQTTSCVDLCNYAMCMLNLGRPFRC